jgi:hypothetical protein
VTASVGQVAGKSEPVDRGKRSTDAKNPNRVGDVRFCDDNVRFTPESGHFRQARQCPLLANNGHSAKANITLTITQLLEMTCGYGSV